MSNRWGLRTYEVNAVLDFFMYHMSGDQRHRLATEMPVAYAKLCGGGGSKQEPEEQAEPDSRSRR